MQKPLIVSILGTTQMTYKMKNIGSDNVRFTADELKQFNTELNTIMIKDERLPKWVADVSGIKAPQKMTKYNLV